MLPAKETYPVFVAVLVFSGIAVAHQGDGISNKVAEAKTNYAAEAKLYRKAIEDLLDETEKKLRAEGDKKKVDRLKSERKAFLEMGVIPSAPPDVAKARMANAVNALRDSYEWAIREYTKISKDEAASNIERELEKFKKDDEFGLIRNPFERFKKGTQVRGELHVWKSSPPGKQSEMRSKWSMTISDVGPSGCNGKLRFEGDDAELPMFISLYENGVIIIHFKNTQERGRLIAAVENGNIHAKLGDDGKFAGYFNSGAFVGQASGWVPEK